MTLGAAAPCGKSRELSRWEAMGRVGEGEAPGKGENPPEDKVPILKPETDEVLPLAGLSHLLPGKHRVSGVPNLES